MDGQPRPLTPKPASTARLFLALWPAPSVRAALMARQASWSWPRGCTPVAAEKLHLTLHFIGTVAAERVPEVAAGLAVPSHAFTLHLAHDALWRHSVAVLEPERIPDALPALHANLADALRKLGLPVEARSFRPHVTFARKADGATPPEPARAAPITWRSSGGYALVVSRGGRYDVLRRYPGTPLSAG